MICTLLRRRAPLAAVRAALAPPETLPDIDLSELVDLEATIPCDGVYQEEPCPNAATWRMRSTCLHCAAQLTLMSCDPCRREWLAKRPMLSTRCCCCGHFRWDWIPL